MVRGDAKRCTGHVGIETQHAAACSQYKHAGHIMPWSHYYCVKRVECICQSI